MSEFEPAFELLMELEGVHSNDENDAGGETKFGVTSQIYDGDIAALTLDQAKGIWRSKWNQFEFYKIENQKLANSLFQLSAVMGPKQAALIFQRALNTMGGDLKEDGVVGDKTRAALPNEPYPFLYVVAAHAEGFFRLITHVPSLTRVMQYEKNQTFLKGWIKRARCA